jgi:hypothetical protein
MKLTDSFILLTSMVVLFPMAAMAAPDAVFFESYCVQCHGADKQKGDVRLDDVSTMDPALWRSVYEQLAAEEMPPDNKKQPEETERRALMTHALELASADVTAPGFRRLNQREYGNTVRDLLGLRKGTFDPGEYIYKDEVSEGFDTEAEELVISNERLLEYMSSAEKSLRHALFSADTEKPASRVVDANPQKMKGTSRRYVTIGKDYVIIRGGGKDKLYDGENTRTMTSPGHYKITITASGTDRDRYPVRFYPAEGPLIMGLEIRADANDSVSSGGKLQTTFELKDDVEQTFEFEVWIDKGHFPYLSFENGSSKPITQIRSNIRRKKIPKSAMNEPFVGPGIRVSQFKVEGPFHDEWPPETFRTTYDSAKIPDLENATAREWLLGRFAERAFRRPVTRADVAPYLAFLERQHAENKDWHESLIRTFAAMMASLDFLYLQEGSGELSAHALASRLSYFLWSTMPDAELLALADSGKIKDADVLKAQVARLLNDPRADRFSESFSTQWLSLDKLGSMPPDIKNKDFKIYYGGDLESAMREETHRYFRHVLRENRRVREFLDSNYSFLNKNLAELYDVPFFGGGKEFVEVSLPANSKRGGILGHASILTLSANGVETSPVERGFWVLNDLLGTPPPPAPAEVPALVPDLNGANTVRQLLEKHRSDPACMECHRQMDPIGFALESYDPIGRYRTKYSKTMAVSTEGEFKGREFADIDGLKKIMLTQTRPFARNLVVRIAEYAKGRKLVPADLKLVESIVDASVKDDFRLNDMIRLIAESDLLRMR